MTEFALADLGYAETIVFRPGFLAGAERTQSRAAETVFGCVYYPFLISPSLRLSCILP